MNRIIRVFPTRTSYTPTDDYAFYGPPELFIPKHDEVHVSCSFTWDKQRAENLAFQWEGRTNKPVKLGGPAFASSAKAFRQGLYLKPNIIFTSRGCNNCCPWCCAPKLEGSLKEYKTIPIGNVIQDNNFLQTSRVHKNNVYEMLKTQCGICFKGGLETDLVDDHFIEAARGLKIAELWLACDTDESLPKFTEACKKLAKAGFNQRKIKCYALIGDDMRSNEARLREIYRAGAMPFAQLYRDFTETKTQYSNEWNAFARMWQRPAATIAHMEKGTDFRAFQT